MRSPTNNWWTEHSFYMGIATDNINKTWDLLQTTDLWTEHSFYRGIVTDNTNKTWDLLQTTDGQNIVFIGK